MRIFLLSILSGLLLIGSAHAKITLPPILGDNMLLQQQCEVKLWGKSDRKSPISLTTGWDGRHYRATPDKEGNWIVKVFTPPAGGTYSITFSDDKNKLTINNILIGEVWHCSGQSNMQMPLKGMTASQPVTGSNDAIFMAARMKKMRIYTVKSGPNGTYTGSWEVVTPNTAAEFSAIGYFFAACLINALDIPVGMICTARGGTRIEVWSAKADLDTFRPEELNSITPGNSKLYNQLVKPISQYTIKGFLWYQGESNRLSNPVSYGEIFRKMIFRWRSDWGQGELPFYFVEVAPMNKTSSVELRESQYRVARTVPGVAMASTIDVGEPDCIHPSQKEVVAKRLAYIALSRTYGLTAIRSDNPTFRECIRKEGGKLWIGFDYAEYGFYPRSDIEGFEVAGADSIFRKVRADAIYVREADRNYIQISTSDIVKPKYVRYCYLPWLKGTLYNTYGLPVLAFSTEIPEE